MHSLNGEFLSGIKEVSIHESSLHFAKKLKEGKSPSSSTARMTDLGVGIRNNIRDHGIDLELQTDPEVIDEVFSTTRNWTGAHREKE
ncbi:hypothetical protein HYZ99_04855 [Candidatus Peregrinibacteria bacterium]|nr:hypothetical protein [Candidatus Peregrinibacteria bacterium]